MKIIKYNEFVDNKEFFIEKLIKSIDDDCGNQSMLNFVYEHPSYEKIISVGESAIPYLLKKINTTNSMFWFEALRKITGDGPDKDKIKSKDIRDSWNKWGEENGY